MQPNIDNETLVDWNMTRLPFPIWIGSVSEAVFLIGAERNSDIILGASYVSVGCFAVGPWTKLTL